MSNKNDSTKNGNRQEVISRDTVGRAQRIRANGHIVTLNRRDAFDLVLVSCHEAGSGDTCEINTRGICPHCLEALFLAGSDAHITLTTCHHEAVANELAAAVSGKITMARSEQTPHGEGRLWVVSSR